MMGISKRALIAMASMAVIACGTLNAGDGNQLAEVASPGEAIVVLKADGTTRLYGVNEAGILTAAEECKIGNLPKEAYKNIEGLAEMSPPLKERYESDESEYCAGVAPNKAWVTGNYGVSVMRTTPNPHPCWFCYTDCSAGNVCRQVCIPSNCKR